MRSSTFIKYSGLLSVVVFAAAVLAANDYPNLSTNIFTLTGGTASTVPYLNASKRLTSSAVTPTELGYLSGVSSAIQTQLNGKISGSSPTLSGSVTFSGLTASTVPYLDASKVLTSSAVTPTQLGLLGTATSSNTISTLVERDGSGNFSAGTITASLSGNATSATTATTATSLASNPTDCSAGNFANAIDASGNLTCGVDGSSLTGLNATNISSGTLANARLNQNLNGLTSLGINDTSAGSALFVKTSAIGVPTATFKAITSQTADLMQVMDSANSPQFIFDSGGNFKLFHNVATPEARFDLRPSVSLTSASSGSAVRYSMYVGQATASATGVGAGIALGGPQTSSTDLTEYAYLWATKNNATSGDVDTSFHIATRRNSDGKAQRVVDMDQAGNSTFFGNLVQQGSTSGTFTQSVPATITSYAVTMPSAQGAANTTIQNNGSGTLTWAQVPLTSGVTGTLPIANGGTNNGSLAVTAGGVVYTDGSKLVNVGAGSTGQVLKSQGSSAPTWGASNGGLISDREMITNTDIEVDASGYTAYADAAGATPVDCTGGSPVSTVARSTTTPITGNGELLWTKAGSANRQGEGFSIPFTVGTADQARVLQIDMDSIVRSGTFVAGATGVDSDLEVYVYDVTNSTLIQPTTYKVYSNSSTIPIHTVSNFQTSSNGTSYRLCVHTATAVTANFTVGFDNLSIHPSRYVYGTPITDWVAYTPTFTGFGTVSTFNFVSRRVGSVLEEKGTFVIGTATATEARISLGYNGTDSNVTSISTLPTLSIAGVMTGGTSSTTYFGDVAVLMEASKTYLTFSRHSSASNGMTKQNGSSFDNGTTMSLTAEVPIAGWSSAVQMSQDAGDGRVVAMRATGASATVTSSYSDLTWTTVASDTHAAMGSINYTVPVPGYYDFMGQVTFGEASAASNQTVCAQLFNTTSSAVVAENCWTYTASTTNSVYVPLTFSSVLLSAGTQVKIQVKSSATTPTITSSATLNFLAIKRISGPSAIAATETIAARYTDSASTPGTGATPSTINFSTKDFDTHGIYSAGTTTIQSPGRYQINSCTDQTAATTAANQQVVLAIYKNGSAVSINRTYFTSTTSKPIGVCVTDLLQLVAGDLITIRGGNDGTTPAINAGATRNWVSISRLGL